MDIPPMHNIKVNQNELLLKENVEIVYEKIVTKFGNSAKLDVPKKYIGMRAYIVIVKD
jgi:putative transposon-encoded protein